MFWAQICKKNALDFDFSSSGIYALECSSLQPVTLIKYLLPFADENKIEKKLKKQKIKNNKNQK